MTDELKIKGMYRLWKNTVDGQRIFLGEYPNVTTKALKDAILNTVAQVSGGGTEIGSSFYMHYIVLGLRVLTPPIDWFNQDLTSIAGGLQYQIIATPPVSLTVSPSAVGVSFETIYTNATGHTETFDLLAGVYANGDATASNIFSICGTSEFILEATESVNIEYVLSFTY